jgi:hypothetical protein
MRNILAWLVHVWRLKMRTNHRMVLAIVLAISTGLGGLAWAGSGGCKTHAWCSSFQDVNKDGTCEQRNPGWPYDYCDHKEDEHN